MVFQHQSSTIIQKHSEEYPHFELITIAPRPWMRTSMYKYSRIPYMVSWSSEHAYLDIICMQQRSGNKRRGSCCPCYCNSRRIMHQLCYVLRPKEGISQFCPHCDTDVPACSNTLDLQIRCYWKRIVTLRQMLYLIRYMDCELPNVSL